MRLSHVGVVLFCVCASSLSAASISIGEHEVLPNTPHQWVPIYASGDEEVAGFQFLIQMGADDGEWLRLSNGLFNEPGMLFSQPGDFTYPTIKNDPYFDFEVSTLDLFRPRVIGDDVLLGLLEIDTTRVFARSTPRSFEIVLSFVYRELDWVTLFWNVRGDPVPTELLNGRLVIAAVPEPPSFVYLALATVSLLAVRKRGTRARL